MSPKAVIAEDEPLLAAEIAAELARAWPQLEIAATVHDGHAAVTATETHRPNILFLDVQMPGLGGLEVAKLVADRAHIVFITAHDHYAVQAFDEGAVDYLLKPLEPARLVRAVQRLKQRLMEKPADMSQLVARVEDNENREQLRWITVQIGRELRLITVDEVCYFRAENKYVAVVTDSGEALINTPLKELAQRLDSDVFWQIHRGTLVNVNAIRSVHRGLSGKLSVQLKTRTERLEVSTTYAHLFRQL
jgi:DNA-binding LytR/AlgR family response regulator